MRDELALIRLLLDRRPNLKLVLDANQGWTREEAWAFCGHLDPNRIEYLGRSVRRLRGHRLRRQPHRHAGGAGRTAGQGSPEAIPTARPGAQADPARPLANNEALVARACELKLKVIVSSCFESGLGLGQLARLAGSGPDQAPGLDTRRWLAGICWTSRDNPIRAGWTPVSP